MRISYHLKGLVIVNDSLFVTSLSLERLLNNLGGKTLLVLKIVMICKFSSSVTRCCKCLSLIMIQVAILVPHVTTVVTFILNVVRVFVSYVNNKVRGGIAA